MEKLRAAKKITMATVKSFIARNRENLYINVGSRFDGMVDCVMPTKSNGFTHAGAHDPSITHKRRLGVPGAFFVGSSRDSLELYEDNEFIGINVYNSCGEFTIAVKKK